MILCEFTPTGGTMIRCSLHDFANIHLWRSFIQSIAALKVAMPQKWGGLAKPTFSDISFSPEMFAGIWPPPENAAIKLRWIEDGDETGGQVVFDGTARRSEPTYDQIKYILKRQENTTKVAGGTVHSGTLATVMATICGASYLNVILDTTRACIPSPAVNHTVPSEILTFDYASDLCAFFGHGGYIENGTLYLIDMYDLVTGQQTLQEWDVASSSTKDGTKYSTAKSGDYTATSTTVLNGDELAIPTAYHTVQANIEAALAIVLEIANRPEVQIDAMMSAVAPRLGGVYIYTDSNHYLPLQSSLLVSDILYNFDDDIMQAIGPGKIVSA